MALVCPEAIRLVAMPTIEQAERCVNLAINPTTAHPKMASAVDSPQISVKLPWHRRHTCTLARCVYIRPGQKNNPIAPKANQRPFDAMPGSAAACDKAGDAPMGAGLGGRRAPVGAAFTTAGVTSPRSA